MVSDVAGSPRELASRAERGFENRVIAVADARSGLDNGFGMC